MIFHTFQSYRAEIVIVIVKMIMIMMKSHMFLFNRALLDTESLCHCICLLQLQFLLLSI